MSLDRGKRARTPPLGSKADQAAQEAMFSQFKAMSAKPLKTHAANVALEQRLDALALEGGSTSAVALEDGSTSAINTPIVLLPLGQDPNVVLDAARAELLPSRRSCGLKRRTLRTSETAACGNRQRGVQLRSVRRWPF